MAWRAQGCDKRASDHEQVLSAAVSTETWREDAPIIYGKGIMHSMHIKEQERDDVFEIFVGSS